jgi:predicted AAA+ superfamily ATPase
MSELIARHAIERVLHLLGTFPVVAITGARQVGKSTLAGQIVEKLGGVYKTLDHEFTRADALDDPQGFVTQTDSLLVIDEIQQAPALMRAIKWAVDRDRRPGRFLITGSANLLGMKTITESLAGRAYYLDLAPLTWSEIVGNPKCSTVDLAFEAESAGGFLDGLETASARLADEARRRAIEGGMPATLGLDPADRRDWYDGYRRTFLERDLRQLSEIENLPEFSRLMTLVMVRSGSLLNRSTLATDSQLAYETLRRYLNILAVAYQVYALPPYFADIGKRLVKSPKLYAADSGLAAYASGIYTWADAVSQGRDGSILETWLVNEIRTMASLGAARPTAWFWRTGAGAEIDLILERGPSVVAMEFKASATPGRRELGAMRSLEQDLGARFKLGIIAHLGDTAEVVSKKSCLVPIPSLLGAVRR